MVIEISVAVMAVCFVVLVIYLVIVLRQFTFTLVQVRGELDLLSKNVHKILESTGELSVNLQKKIEAFDPLFKAFNNLGEVVEQRTSDFKKEWMENRLMDEEEESPFHDQNHIHFHKFTKLYPPKKRQNALAQVGELFEMAGIGIRLWQNLKQRR